MTYLFIFAHPDDETVSCAGTIKQLLDTGERVVVVSVTNGGAGEVIESAQEQYTGMSVDAIRLQEFTSVMKYLGVLEFELLDFPDGTINNGHVWGSLKDAIVEVINRYQADVVITFDHTGWYYHLDHVGTSIATTLAFHDQRTKANALLYSHFRPEGEHDVWDYKYSETMPITHQVAVPDIQHKIEACLCHVSQDLEIVEIFLKNNDAHFELYEWGFGDERVKQKLEESIFKPVLEK